MFTFFFIEYLKKSVSIQVEYCHIEGTDKVFSSLLQVPLGIDCKQEDNQWPSEPGTLTGLLHDLQDQVYVCIFICKIKVIILCRLTRL